MPLADWLRGRSWQGQHDEVWFRGRAVMDAGPRVAIVGARAATRPGMAFARELAGRLVAWQQVVVSGGALGIDAAAHEGALAGDGVTLAVLGTGIDIAYPYRHAGLFDRICQRGAILSPYPPGSSALPWHFAARNPIIAALADTVVIVEAGVQSGSLGTAAAAERLGRTLFARPGSPGCDELIAAGKARPALTVEALAAELLGLGAPQPTDVPRELVPVLEALSHLPASVDALSARLPLSHDAVLTALCELELAGHAIRLEDGRYLALQAAGDLKE